MSEYADMTIKSHKKYGIKIVFLIFKECHIDNGDKLSDLVTKYHKIIEDNKGIYSVIDTRGVNGFSKTLAFSKAKTLKKYETMVEKNLLSMSILIDNYLLEILVNTISKIHPFVVPTKISKTNKGAMDFIIEHHNRTLS
jgi:hypothetical protein